MALFTTTLDERREAFVRARFAEPAIFGFGDIEERLKNQRVAEKPDSVRWSKLLDPILMEHTVSEQRSLLASCATPTSVLDHEAIKQSSFKMFLSLPGTNLYFGTHEGIYISPGDEPEMKDVIFILLEVDNSIVIKRLGIPLDGASKVNSKTLFWILLAEWNNHRPQWQNSRTVLCDSIAEKIKLVREGAVLDFNKAVAVSEDGARIVHADWVVVADNNGSVLYPGQLFQAQKAKLYIEAEPRGDGLITVNKRAAIIKVLNDFDITYLRPNKTFGTFRVVRCGRGFKTFKLLVISRDFCEDPLPEGGVKI